MASKLLEAAQKRRRRLDGHNELPRPVPGCDVNDGIEIMAKPTGRQPITAPARQARPSPRSSDNFLHSRKDQTNTPSNSTDGNTGEKLIGTRRPRTTLLETPDKSQTT
jgi:hypothetical protein